MLTIREAAAAVGEGLRRAGAWLGFGGTGAPGTAPPDPADPVPEPGTLPPDLVEPVIAPVFGIDGWTYQGTELEEFFPAGVEPEIAALVHAVCAQQVTSWGYERAATLLERHHAFGQAYSVLQARIDRARAEADSVDGALLRWRGRLARAVIAGPGER